MYLFFLRSQSQLEIDKPEIYSMVSSISSQQQTHIQNMKQFLFSKNSWNKQPAEVLEIWQNIMLYYQHTLTYNLLNKENIYGVYNYNQEEKAWTMEKYFDHGFAV